MCLFGSGAMRWQCPIAAAAISKKYNETIGRLEGLLGLWIAAIVYCTKFLCNLCILHARAVWRVGFNFFNFVFGPNFKFWGSIKGPPDFSKIRVP